MPIYSCPNGVTVNGLTMDFPISPGELCTVTVVNGVTDQYSLVYNVADRTVVAVISGTQLQKLISDGSFVAYESA